MHLELILSILLGVLFGITCSYLAKDKGRSPLNWFIIGLLFGIIGLVVLLLMPRIKKPEEDAPQVEEAPQKVQPIEEVESEEEPSTINSPPTQSELYRMNPWYYLDGKHVQIGPVDFQDILEAWRYGEISLSSYVWTDTMSNWQKIEQLPDLRALLQKE
jgi:hypothetical protein